MTIRNMTPNDYDGIKDLWMTIHGFAIRSIDDSREDVTSFLKRNPTTSVVAEDNGTIVGAILCGHDGRYGHMYHACIREEYRLRGIGMEMVVFCMRALQRKHINKIALIAFTNNDIGNAF